MPCNPVILCLGDSHTFGRCGAPWVQLIAKAFPGVRFINAGVDGTQTKNVHSRVDKVLAGVRGRLAAVTLLIGTNDCLRSLWQDASNYWGEQYYKLINGDTGPANAETFGMQYRSLITDLAMRLRQRAATETDTGETKLLVINLPPTGEDLNDRANKRVDEYNTVVQAAVAELQQQQQQQKEAMGVYTSSSGHVTITLLDLSTACKEAITRAFGVIGGDNPIPPAVPPCRLPTSFGQSSLTILTCLLRRYAFGLSFQRQSVKAGTVVLTPDCIHLNDTGARLLAQLIRRELQPLAPATGPSVSSIPAPGT